MILSYCRSYTDFLKVVLELEKKEYKQKGQIF